MFCVMCTQLKAENGCYAEGSDNRICLQCYMNMVGNYPLPSGVPPSLGGAFADGKALVKSFKDTVNSKKEEAMDTVSKTISAEAGGFQQDVGEYQKAFREKKEAFWSEMPDDVQKYRNDFNNKKKEIVGEAKETAGQAVDAVADAANSVFQSIADVF